MKSKTSAIAGIIVIIIVIIIIGVTIGVIIAKTITGLRVDVLILLKVGA